MLGGTAGHSDGARSALRPGPETGSSLCGLPLWIRAHLSSSTQNHFPAGCPCKSPLPLGWCYSLRAASAGLPWLQSVQAEWLPEGEVLPEEDLGSDSSGAAESPDVAGSDTCGSARAREASQGFTVRSLPGGGPLKGFIRSLPQHFSLQVVEHSHPQQNPVPGGREVSKASETCLTPCLSHVEGPTSLKQDRQQLCSVTPHCPAL